MFEGSMVALVTPFRDGELDYASLEGLVEHQIAGGTSALVVSGTTGESPTLSGDESRELLRFVVDKTAGRVPVVAGTGSNSTAATVAKTQEAADLGAAGAMVVSPYYNKPGEQGLEAHFLAVADASPLPVMLYDIPGRTGSRIPSGLATRLGEHPRIVALKEATGLPSAAMDLVAGGALSVLAGDDASTLPWIALGACGLVSVAANALPAEMAALVAAARTGDLQEARDRHYRMLPLFRALFMEPNPTPVKALLADLGLCTDEVRLPLVAADEETRRELRRAHRIAIGREEHGTAAG